MEIGPQPAPRAPQNSYSVKSSCLACIESLFNVKACTWLWEDTIEPVWRRDVYPGCIQLMFDRLIVTLALILHSLSLLLFWTDNRFYIQEFLSRSSTGKTPWFWNMKSSVSHNLLRQNLFTLYHAFPSPLFYHAWFIIMKTNEEGPKHLFRSSFTLCSGSSRKYI